MTVITFSTRARFYSKIKAMPSGCWEWQAHTARGYGHIKVDGKDVKAHRLSWEMQNGPIPVGLKCLHRCDNPLCVNPEHLFLGTQQDNIADMNAKGRARGAAGERNCKAKLTEVMAEIIREKHATGLFTYTALAREFMVSPQTIRAVVLQQTWSGKGK